MHFVGRIRVIPAVPEQLSRLSDIAYNLWWTWNPEILDIFSQLDGDLWERTEMNPVRFIHEISREKLAEKACDPGYMSLYRKREEIFNSYLTSGGTAWFARKHHDRKDHMLAYFSAEYGLTEILPIYSGGLGVLSGDFCKSASDLGMPFTAIGLFYRNGYFEQRIGHDGRQYNNYPSLDLQDLPVLPVTDANGTNMRISVDMAGRTVHAGIWKVRIGRIELFLMDTDTEQNDPQDRLITSRLYGGDQETRIQQEILLGIGGIRLLDAMDVKPSVCHMNEGHSAFMGLEMTRKLMERHGLNFRTAKEAARSSIAFTTHTPVPAGNDVFPVWMIERYFSRYWESLGISRQEFMMLGLKPDDYQNFNMSVLALNLAGKTNGVSQLHGAVTRTLYSGLWPGIPESEVPITHITNGIHTLTWLSRPFREIFDQYLPDGWKSNIPARDTWNAAAQIPAGTLWKAHCALKKTMIGFIREKVREQRINNGETADGIRDADSLLDPDALTIGFARRFATYKRANLIFRDFCRITRLLGDSKRPVQIIFAGKAHPADKPAQEVIRQIVGLSGQGTFKGKIVVLENYNMAVARYLSQGADIWLNNPRRPLEASGTSGQKACINGVINFSVLDGWWCEGYNNSNGWSIGDKAYYEDEMLQDNSDSNSIYEILEDSIIPSFYDRDQDGVPLKWVDIMKESISSLAYYFNTDRAMAEYFEKIYLPLEENTRRLSADNYRMASHMVEWKSFIAQNWSQTKIIDTSAADERQDCVISSGEPLKLSMTVDLCKIPPESVKAELVYGHIAKSGNNTAFKIKEMSREETSQSNICRYSTEIRLDEGGEFGYTFRILPYHPLLIDKFDAKQARWANQ